MTAQSMWTYWTEPQPRGAEFASWQGDRLPETRAHFHDEDQITLVLSGSREFSVAGKEVQLFGGDCLTIPAGVPHRSLSLFAPDTHCINLYVNTGIPLGGPLAFPAGDDLDFRNATDTIELRTQILSQIAARALAASESAPARTKHLSVGRGPIARIAERHGLSREGFSRTFRREVGMPPHTFRLMIRLNAARQQFRSGHGIASVAAELGFADQSHLGRHFRNAFGVTPGRYIDGIRRSQTSQT